MVPMLRVGTCSGTL